MSPTVLAYQSHLLQRGHPACTVVTKDLFHLSSVLAFIFRDASSALLQLYDVLGSRLGILTTNGPRGRQVSYRVSRCGRKTVRVRTLWLWSHKTVSSIFANYVGDSIMRVKKKGVRN